MPKASFILMVGGAIMGSLIWDTKNTFELITERTNSFEENLISMELRVFGVQQKHVSLKDVELKKTCFCYISKNVSSDLIIGTKIFMLEY